MKQKCLAAAPPCKNGVVLPRARVLQRIPYVNVVDLLSISLHT
jgi:hypothetical protein